MRTHLGYILLLLGAFTALADTLSLRTGERLVGKVISEEPMKSGVR